MLFICAVLRCESCLRVCLSDPDGQAEPSPGRRPASSRRCVPQTHEPANISGCGLSACCIQNFARCSGCRLSVSSSTASLDRGPFPHTNSVCVSRKGFFTIAVCSGWLCLPDHTDLIDIASRPARDAFDLARAMLASTVAPCEIWWTAARIGGVASRPRASVVASA